VVALIGILTTMAVSVFLLPPLLAPSCVRKES
jgi:hypothetical protein